MSGRSHRGTKEKWDKSSHEKVRLSTIADFCRGDCSRGYLFTAAQIFNLPYRRFVIGMAPVTPRPLDFADDPQVTNLRYSRLQVCATDVGSTARRYSRGGKKRGVIHRFMSEVSLKHFSSIARAAARVRETFVRNFSRARRIAWIALVTDAFTFARRLSVQPRVSSHRTIVDRCGRGDDPAPLSSRVDAVIHDSRCGIAGYVLKR